MNDTAAALGNQANSIFGNSSPGVIVVLILVALMAAITIIGLIYGAHQKRRRKQAEAEVEDHAGEEHEATGDEVAEAATPPVREVAPAPAPPTSTPQTPRPLAPAPTPVAEEPLADEPLPETDAITASPAAETGIGTDDMAAAGMADAPVTTLKGLGPKVAAQLGALGIATVGDLAALDDRAAEDLDARLGAFTGRMKRDRWVEQARLLAAGDRKGFEERFGKL